MDLRSALTAHSDSIYTEIRSFFKTQERESKEIDRYLTRSVQMLQTFTLRGGKAIRPFLGFLAYQLANGKPNKSLNTALASIELHHKHLLILDDIADRDQTRYGGPTLEYAYRKVLSTSTDFHRALSFAMFDGVLLGSFSKEILASSTFSADTIRACMHLLNVIMYRDTLAGWQIHGMQCIQPLKLASQEEFIKGLRYVTASYTFEGPLLIGLTLAQNKNTSLEKALRTYAEEVGTAFQIHDDILGLFGDPSVTGKPVGNDVREGKKTLLLQEAYQRASTSEREILEAACGKDISTDMLQRVQQIVRESGSLAHSQALEQQYVARGIEALQELPASEAKDLLIELARYVISREK